MKKRRDDARGGHDRWLLSYADLVTLLLALFTVLYAASNVDAGKLAPIESSLREAFDAPPIMENVAARGPLVPPIAVVAGQQQAATDDLERRLQLQLADALRSRRIDIHRDARGLIVSLPEEAAFAVASTDISDEARDLIGKIAEAVSPTTSGIRIEGHTDNVPIRTARYSSNWELSTARAAAVVAYMVEGQAFDPQRLSAAGYGEFHPRVDNDTAENRARNRRIDVVILATEP